MSRSGIASGGLADAQRKLRELSTATGVTMAVLTAAGVSPSSSAEQAIAKVKSRTGEKAWNAALAAGSPLAGSTILLRAMSTISARVTKLPVSFIEQDDTEDDGAKECAKCGANQDENAKFCDRCGARMSGEKDDEKERVIQNVVASTGMARERAEASYEAMGLGRSTSTSVKRSDRDRVIDNVVSRGTSATREQIAASYEHFFGKGAAK